MNKQWKWVAAGAVVAILAVAAYQVAGSRPGVGGTNKVASAASAASGAAVSVTTALVQQRDFEVQLEATGTVTAASSVDVRPQVSSVITRVHVREGQFVKAGELLFTLDARTDEANVARAQAQLARDQAQLADAQRQLNRSRELLAQNFVSQAALDSTLAQVESQAAVVAADKVAIDAARVGLGYARIVAPSAGRVGTVPVFVGSTVQANSTVLVTITQLDPIFVSFNLPQRYVADALQSLRDGGGRVSAALPEAATPLLGRLQFVDSAVDTGSGTVKVKAVFNNAAQALWPGAFVNVKLTAQTLKNALLVPQAALVQSARGRTVFVIDAAAKAQARPVEVLNAAGSEAVVSGLRAGERVIIDGRQNVRPGVAVIERAAGGRGAASSASSAASAGSAAASSASAVPTS